jgi:GNAT superfamily N-acetyltransferase
MSLTLRPARRGEIPALNLLIADSARALSRGYYTDPQIESAVTHVFGVDSRLVDDGSYLVAEREGEVAGCGGWSRFRALYGGDQRPVGGDDVLDPASEAARIRAFFVAPAHARRGVGRALLLACADAARQQGFQRLELMATLPGVPLYSAMGFRAIREVVDRLPDETLLPFVQMGCAIADLER